MFYKNSNVQFAMPLLRCLPALFILAILTIAASCSRGASADSQDKPEAVKLKDVDEKPDFPGGPKAFAKYRFENMPHQIKGSELGEVIVRFIVEEDGSIEEVDIVKGVSERFDKAIKNMFLEMPRWKPGKVDGKPVRTICFSKINLKKNGICFDGEEVILEDEVAAQDVYSEIVIIEEIDPEKEVRDINEVLDNTTQIGAENHEGKEDLSREMAKEVVVEEKPAEKPKEESPLNMAMVEQKPTFPGGDAAMYKWLGEHLNYPADAAEEGVQGKVFVQFIVEKDGHITGVKVTRGKHPSLDKEAKRVVGKMPKWVPGRNNGEPVRVIYNLPVNFRLSQE